MNMNKSNWYTLYNGVEMPPVGFGTDRAFIYLRKNIIKGFRIIFDDIFKENFYHIRRDRSISNIVKTAPSVGCHLFDTASSYGQSERVLGHCLRKCDRDEYFICTKISNEEQRTGNVFKAYERSLKKLGVDVIDLFLMHWPQTETFVDCWLQMEKLYEQGLVKAIGVCNFKQHHFEELMVSANIKPHVCQIESHPLFAQHEMREYCKKNMIQMMAYTPTGRMDERIIHDKSIQEISNNHNRSIAQTIIRWHFQHHVIPVINTTKLEHLMDNMNIFDFELSEEEMVEIDMMNRNVRLRYDPDTVDFYKC